MAKTNWQDPGSTEITSPDISGLQEAVGKVEESINMESVAEKNIPLEEVFISNDDRYRIFQASLGKRNWLLSPTPVIKKNGTVINEDFTINYGGGAVVFAIPITGSDTLTADATYTKRVSGKNLSTNDYTTADKNKLAGIEASANKYTHPNTHPASMITGLPTKLPANGGNADTVNNKTVQTNVPANAKFTDTVYTHPTTPGNKHIPSGGVDGQALVNNGSGTAKWANLTIGDIYDLNENLTNLIAQTQMLKSDKLSTSHNTSNTAHSDIRGQIENLDANKMSEDTHLVTSANGSPMPITDLNGLSDTADIGFYIYSSTATSIPYAGAQGVLIHMGRDSRPSQIATSYANNSLYIRSKNGSNWSSWNEIVTTNTIDLKNSLLNGWTINGVINLTKKSNEIYLIGSIRNGTSTNGTSVLSIPAGYRPPSGRVLSCTWYSTASGNPAGVGLLRVTADGYLRIDSEPPYTEALVLNASYYIY